MTAPRFLLSLPKHGASPDPRGELVHMDSPATAVGDDNAAIWCDGDMPFMQTAGVSVIGNLFERRSYAPVPELPAGAATEILASPESLVRNYWGAFVAVLSRTDGGFVVVRDPSGSIPCYVVETPRTFIIASDLAAFEAAGLELGCVAWDRLFEHLVDSSTRRTDTCVEGVSELAPGAACWFGSGGRTQEFLWSPWPFAEADVRLDAECSARELREVVCKSVSALASRHRRIIVGVSGGLDSSIVCAALAAGGHDFACLTMATTDASGDERPYARQVAAAMGADLLEHHYDPASIDIARSAAAHLPRPVAKPFMQEFERAYASEVTSRGADAVFTGNGGDNVFCYLHSASPVVDAIRERQSISAIVRTIGDMCSVTQCDIFAMTRATLLALFKPRAAPGQDLTLLNRERFPARLASPLTPYHLHSPPNRPGAMAHVRLITRIQNHVEGYDRTSFPPVVPALLAQPIVETCLRIPPWQWCRGGINRSVAREAFGELLPRPIIRRISKAGPESLTAALFSCTRQQLRDMLLEGVLRAQAIIDPRAVEVALDDPSTVHGQMLFRLLELADAEAWARSRGTGPVHVTSRR